MREAFVFMSQDRRIKGRSSSKKKKEVAAIFPVYFCYCAHKLQNTANRLHIHSNRLRKIINLAGIINAETFLPVHPQYLLINGRKFSKFSLS
jgi:sugar diacid utilization regulator